MTPNYIDTTSKEPHSFDTQTIEYVNELLHAELGSIFSACSFTDKIAEKLSENQILFEAKLHSLSLKDNSVSEVNNALLKKIIAIENKLMSRNTFGTLTTHEGLTETAQYLHSLCPASTHTGCFLKRTTAESLLHAHPPTQILNHFSLSSTEDLLEKINALDVLSLIRHTESDTWLTSYFELLKKCTAEDFEEREVRHFIIEWEAYKKILEADNRCMKPWRISHSKETGTINCFVLGSTNNFKSPLLQCSAVYLHYFFETAYTGRFMKQEALTSPDILGEKLVAVIKSGKKKFPFFHTNAYSEHLFWEQGLALLMNTLRDDDDVAFFKNTISCGDACISFNIVDHIWNSNIPLKTSTNGYFKLNTPTFLYHFQEAMWYELFKRLLNDTEKEMADAVISRLHLGDTVFTDTMIQINHSV